MRCIVFLAAHADDVELAAGGTCAMLCDKGYDVRIIVATDEADTSIAGLRRREAVAGAAMLGVDPKKVYFLGLQDGYVACNRETVTALRALVAGFGVTPVAVFTHTQSDSHQDHVATAKLARAAFRQVSMFKFFVRNSAILSGFAPSLHTIVDPYVATKERALGAHVSQDRADRICLDKVRAFSKRFARGKGGEFCEPFELEIQNDASDISDLIALLDGSPFSRLWSPVLSSAPLTVLAGQSSGTAAAPGGLSELMYITQLQARLMSTVRARLDDSPFARIAVRHAMGASDEIHAENGHVLVLGSTGDNPAASALFDWIGLSPDGRTYRRSRKGARASEVGLLTIAANPFARRKGERSFLFGATGPDQASSMAAAMALLDDAKISGILDRANDVFAGRTPAVHIEITGAAQARAKPKQRAAAPQAKILRFVSA